MRRQGRSLRSDAACRARAARASEAAIAAPDRGAAPLHHLFDSNRAWAADITRRDPEFFRRLSGQQAPQYLWIGCSDSRVPANEIVGLLPGELFVHRNVANVVVHGDLNCLSVIQFAVDVLGVDHIIVCGHYGCGGVRAALLDEKHGLVDNWLRHVQDVRLRHQAQLDQLPTESERVDRLCELNVVEQVVNVAQTTVVRDAWARGKSLSVHGWVYGLGDGHLRDLGITVAAPDEIQARADFARLGA
ncbi:carbonate dehydratase [soil metagenome]